MRILAFSDLHLDTARAAELVEAGNSADLVIGAGDFCNMREGLDLAMDMLGEIRRPTVLVPGNAESADELRAAVPEGFAVLHGQGMTISGLKLFGLGYGVPKTPFGDWSCDLDEDTAAEMLKECEAADIMILHSPPRAWRMRPLAVSLSGPWRSVTRSSAFSPGWRSADTSTTAGEKPGRSARRP